MTKKENVEDSVLRALQYSNIFHYPLSFFQIAMYIDEKIAYEDLQNSVKKLVQKKIVIKKGNAYRLKGEKCVNWNQKQTQAKKLYKKYSKLLKGLERIPWIHMLALTGSLAASNPEDKDDVDIFIIAKKNRLWLTRFFVVMYLKIWGIYRTPEMPSGKICPNLLVSEKALAWPKEKQNAYVAAEIVRMQVVINRNNAYLRFLSQNKWINEFFPNFEFEEVGKLEGRLPNVLDLFEIVFFFGQRVFMSPKITTEEVRKNFIHFNKYDKTEEILGKYEA